MSRVALVSFPLAVVALCAASGRGAAWAQAAWGPGENGIIFSEVHYHPPGDVADEEFVEIHNGGLRWVDVGGWTISAGIEFQFPARTVLAPGESLAVARNAAVLRARSGSDGARIIGNFSGRLGNAGERLILKNRTGRTISFLHYRDGRGYRGGLWPRGPDGRGGSLELIEAHAEWEHPWRWDTSRAVGGTPGATNSVARDSSLASSSSTKRSSRKRSTKTSSSEGRLRINEVCWAEGESFIEIVNSGGASASLDGVVITTKHLAIDSATKAARLKGSLGAGKLARARGAEVDALLATLRSALESSEGSGKKDKKKSTPRVYLFARGRMLLDAIEARRVPEGASLGRVPDGGRDLITFPTPSGGKSNRSPSTGEVVINEILYSSSDSDSSDEFIELHNPSKKAGSLSGWEIDDAVTFEFPAGAEIPRGGFVVVAKDPAVAKAVGLGVPQDVKIFGPFKGRLANKTERIVLRNAWGTTIDEVRYADRAPWPSDADGRALSIELLHPGVDNRFGLAWARGGPGGTPGSRNRRYDPSFSPQVVDVWHEPAAPLPGDTVTIHATVLSPKRISDVRVAIYREGSSSRASPKRMSDKGTLGDGAAKDGHFAVEVKMPTRVSRAVLLEYRFSVRVSGGRSRTYPEGARGYLLRVEPERDRVASIPNYQILMIARDADRFAKQGRSAEDLYQCTFIASIDGPGTRRTRGRVRHGCTVRLRGNNSRRPPDGRMSYRLRLPGGEYFDGRDRLILNAFDAFRQKAGGDFMKQAGLPAPRTSNIRISIPGQEDDRYVDVEVVDSNYLVHRFGSDDGELFRGKRGRPFGADFSFHGRDNIDQYLAVYLRVNKTKSRDLDALFDLLEALEEGPPKVYYERVSKLVDIDEWATYFAANNLLGNTEGGLSVSDADDFFVGRRAEDGKWVLIPWDHDSTFGDPRQKLFRPSLPALKRFLAHPKIAPVYQRRIHELVDGPLSGTEFSLEGIRLSRTYHAQQLDVLARFARERQVRVREQVLEWPNAGLLNPQDDESSSGTESVGVGVGVGRSATRSIGFGSRLFTPRTRGAIPIWGLAEPGITFGVSVNGKPARYEATRGEWFASVSLDANPTSVHISILDAFGDALRTNVVMIHPGARPVAVPDSLTGRTTWTARDGPYLLQGNVAVAGGSVLRIEPGTEIICAADASLEVRGRLEVVGEKTNPVAFRMANWRRPWRGIRFPSSGGVSRAKEHVLSFCRFEGGEGVRETQPLRSGEKAPPRTIDDPKPFLRVGGVQLTVDGCVLRGIRGHAIVVDGGGLRMRDSVITDSRHGILALAGSVEVQGSTFRNISGRGVDLRRLRKRDSKISRSFFRHVQAEAVCVDGSEIELEDVVVSGSRAALVARAGGKVIAHGLTTAECGVGVLVDSSPFGDPAPSPAGSQGANGPTRLRAPRSSSVRVDASVLWPCAQAIVASRSARVEVSDSVIEDRVQRGGGSGVKVRGARTGPVEFRDPIHGDFRARSTP